MQVIELRSPDVPTIGAFLYKQLNKVDTPTDFQRGEMLKNIAESSEGSFRTALQIFEKAIAIGASSIQDLEGSIISQDLKMFEVLDHFLNNRKKFWSEMALIKNADVPLFMNALFKMVSDAVMAKEGYFTGEDWKARRVMGIASHKRFGELLDVSMGLINHPKMVARTTELIIIISYHTNKTGGSNEQVRNS